MTPPSETRSESESSLSCLVVSVGNADEDQPLPLRVSFPQHFHSDIWFGLSPRLTVRIPYVASLANSGSPEGFGSGNWTPDKSLKVPRLLHAASLRRSPRSSSTSPKTAKGEGSCGSDPVSGKSGSARVGSCSKMVMFRTSEEMPLRRSPRFPVAVVPVENVETSSHVYPRKRSMDQELPLNAYNVNHIGEKCLRRSPRLTSPQSKCKRVSLGNTMMRQLESPENLSSDVKKYLNSFSEDVTEGTIPFSHSKLEMFGQKLFKSPSRLNPTTKEHKNKEVVSKLDVQMGNGMNLRSPRISSSIDNVELKVIHKRKEIDSVHQEDECSFTSNKKHSKIINSSNKPLKKSLDSKYIKQSKERTSSFALSESDEKSPSKELKTSVPSPSKNKSNKSIPSFVGDPIVDDEARERWGWRYEMKGKVSKSWTSVKNQDDDEDEIILNVKCHYAQAKIDNSIISLGDCAFIEGEGGKKHVGKILEFFRTTDGKNYFRVQWFYRVEDTVIKGEGDFHDKRRLFYSSIMNDNLIECIIAKVNVKQIKPRVGSKLNSIFPSDFYYDMEYCVDYSTFRSLDIDKSIKSCELSSPSSIETNLEVDTINKMNFPNLESSKEELILLDLYSGCGGMSTGLCLGTKVSSVNLLTRWAVDSDASACKSLKLNHPETYVRNESAEDFLGLLKEWEKLRKRYKVYDAERVRNLRSKTSTATKGSATTCTNDEISSDELEVSRLVDICYGDPDDTGDRGLKFKVHWEGYSSSEDTWEPIEGLRNCQEKIKEFVRDGIKSKILPLPGEVDVICGGPPCQGISGYNRFRNCESPLDDERNRQIVVFMDIVKFLKPKYVLMENVVDILRFDKASLGRYALSRLVHMNYQARLGTIAAGCYGLPQFRLRVFLWGAHPREVLPQFPLPTHDVIVKYWPPPEFERNTVAYDEDKPHEVEKAILLEDAVSDLPAVTNNETCEEISYEKPPESEFQRYIRSNEFEMTGSTNGNKGKVLLLYDHRPMLLFEDDYQRVCQIPKRKGANFRDLPGVIVGADNVAQRDPTMDQQFLPSGRPLVPDYCFTFEQGKSKRPFARLWWDETVPTVLTFPSCHNQVILHPEQDRILTVREFARLQGFPDYYRFSGTVKERYCQIGNAVAVSVSKALGYALGMAYRKLSGNEPLMKLPPKFSQSNYLQLTNNLPDN